MIQGLRKQEDERLDEEMDIMNEIEGGGGGSVLPKVKKSGMNPDGAGEKTGTAAVAESQITSTLDADGLVKLTEDDDRTAFSGGGGQGREGDVAVPARKKKGQKRQTRRVIREFRLKLLSNPSPNIKCGYCANIASQSVLIILKSRNRIKKGIQFLRTKMKMMSKMVLAMMIFRAR